MKAVLLHGYGGVEQLHYESAPEPVAKAGEMLVRVIATSINPIDYKLRSGVMKERMPLELPAILGRDVAGEVTALGECISKFKVGDKVMGLVNQSYAEYLTAEADALCLVPDGLNEVDAGALPLVTLTGAQLIEAGLQPQSGETVMVTGALGSVGRTAVFVAKQHGAIVIAGVRAKQKEEAGAIGADSIVALDSEDEISKLPELDAIADTVGGDALGKVLAKLKKSGRLASVVGKSEVTVKAGVKVNEVWAHPDAERLHQLAEDYRDGKLKITIDKRMRLSEVREAQTEAESGGRGKIILVP